MGMFDYVKVDIKCPYCYKRIKSRKFQTTSEECIMIIKDWKRVYEFYGNCPYCNKWIEYKRRWSNDIEDFELIKED